MLLPIFLGFCVTHLVLIVYGICACMRPACRGRAGHAGGTGRWLRDIGWVAASPR